MENVKKSTGYLENTQHTKPLVILVNDQKQNVSFNKIEVLEIRRRGNNELALCTHTQRSHSIRIPHALQLDENRIVFLHLIFIIYFYILYILLLLDRSYCWCCCCSLLLNNSVHCAILYVRMFHACMQCHAIERDCIHSQTECLKQSFRLVSGYFVVLVVAVVVVYFFFIFIYFQLVFQLVSISLSLSCLLAQTHITQGLWYWCACSTFRIWYSVRFQLP